MKRYVVPLLALVCFIVCLLSIVDSLSSDDELCPMCGHVMEVSGPCGKPEFQLLVVRCTYCGFGFVREVPMEAE